MRTEIIYPAGYRHVDAKLILLGLLCVCTCVCMYIHV